MDRTVGILGGGQLGRMLAEAANQRNIKIIVLDSEEAPAKRIIPSSGHVTGSFTDPAAIRDLAQKCDVLTVEIEHVNTDALQDLATSRTVEIQPSWRTIRLIQDKYKQKEYLNSCNVETAQSLPLESGTRAELERIAGELGYPLMLKSRTEAYDGRGNRPVKSASEIDTALASLRNRPLYAEKWADFKVELAVMVVKTENDTSHDWQKATMAFPVVETVHEDSICKLVFAPARNISETIIQEAKDLARRAVARFWGKGIFGVELFLLGNGTLLVNEIAPRPHNSGHYTIEACRMSQYEAHLDAILDIPIPEGGTEFVVPRVHAIMLNLIGSAQPDSHLLAAQMAHSQCGAKVHMYGKGDSRPGRKMGHVTILAESMIDAEARMEPLIRLVDRLRAAREQSTSQFIKMPGMTFTPSVKSDRRPVPAVAITMGSDSDAPVLKPGIDLLTELGVPFSVTITSAHRTPSRMVRFAQEAAPNGVKVIIAAAGGAAHLPGMIAANTPLPKGVPVATVGINNSVNAAQLAVRILGAIDLNARQRLERYLADQELTVIEKAERMEALGIEAYSLNK